MNLILKAILSTAFALTAIASQAASFNFTYDILPGYTISGGFSGTVNGDLVTNLSNVSVAINGTPFKQSGNLYVFNYNDISYSSENWSSGGVASFSGTKNNFLFTDGPVCCHYGDTYSNFFGSLTQNQFYQAFANNLNTQTYLQYPQMGTAPGIAMDPSKWTLTAAVPEPETYAMLLAGLGLIGAAAKRRKAKQA